MIFLPEMVGVELVREMTSSAAPRAATTRETTLDSGRRALDLDGNVAGSATSVLVTGAEQELAEVHVVTRAEPLMRSVEPGPGLEMTKPLPLTVRVKPFVPPA